MRRNGYWTQILGLIVSLVFLYFGIQIALDGNYAFALIWILLTGTTAVQQLRTFIASLKNGVADARIHDIVGDEDEVDVYGHRTSASYEKQRLRKIEELYRDGLLTREEYEKKRAEIIDTL